jgi:hypothetical protein
MIVLTIKIRDFYVLKLKLFTMVMLDALIFLLQLIVYRSNCRLLYLIPYLVIYQMRVSVQPVMVKRELIY